MSGLWKSPTSSTRSKTVLAGNRIDSAEIHPLARRVRVPGLRTLSDVEGPNCAVAMRDIGPTPTARNHSCRAGHYSCRWEEPPRGSGSFCPKLFHASQLLQVRKCRTKDLLGDSRSLHSRLEALLHLLTRVDVVAEVTYLTGVS